MSGARVIGIIEIAKPSGADGNELMVEKMPEKLITTESLL